MINAKDIKNKAKDVIYVDDIQEQMYKSFREGFKRGETTYFKSIDKHFRLLKGNIILFGGMGNYGKSKLLKQICLLRAKHNGEKWAIFTPEEMPPEYFYNDLIHSYIGKSVYKWHENQMTEDEYQRGIEFVKNHFFYLYPENDNPTPDYINQRFEEIVKKHKIDGCIIDPFNQLYNDWEQSGRDDRYINGFLANEKRFALKHNVYKITVHHTKSNVTKTEQGDYRMPTVYDLHGGAMWNNGCDEIVFVHRPYRISNPDDNTTLFKSEKIKKQIICGVPGEVELTFDFMSNRFSDNENTPLDNSNSDSQIKIEIEDQLPF